MTNDLKNNRDSAIGAVMRHLIPAYEMCKTQNLIDSLTFNLGMAMGKFMLENEATLKTHDRLDLSQ
jgi:hypothetical protein